MSTLLKTSSSSPSKIGLKWRYFLLIPLILMSIFYLIPLYVMVVTGPKSFDEASLLTMWDLPKTLGFDNFFAAFENLAPSLWNSFKMVIPAAIISSFVGSINGFVLAKWKFRGADVIFPLILFGMFIPYQSILIPLVVFMRDIGLYGSIFGLVIVHVIYGIPITTLSINPPIHEFLAKQTSAKRCDLVLNIAAKAITFQAAAVPQQLIAAC